MLNRFRDERTRQEREHRRLKALLEQVPVPLISLYADEQIVLWNNAARHLFNGTAVTKLADLAEYGPQLPGERKLVPFRHENLVQTLSILSSEIAFDQAHERLVSLQNIQSALDGSQQRAWSDLVQVLTHEIMNSVTPIASLAGTSKDLVEDLRQRSGADIAADLENLGDAVGTVARRSEGLMSFVANYRLFSDSPTPKVTNFAVAQLFDDVARVSTLEWPELGLALECAVDPQALELSADRQLTEQVLINLLQNAQHALAGAQTDGSEQPAGIVQLAARLNRSGRVSIEVTDNGPGISSEPLEQIFVPFYTTRRDGSGIGLAFSRQVMVAHGGSIQCSNRDSGGARFTLRF